MFDPIVVKHGPYTLKEVTTKRGEYCKVYFGRYLVGTYCSIRDAMYHRCEWDTEAHEPSRTPVKTFDFSGKDVRSAKDMFAHTDAQK